MVRITSLLSITTQQEQRVLFLCYVEGLGQQEAGDIVGLSQPTISRMLDDIFDRVRRTPGVILELPKIAA